MHRWGSTNSFRTNLSCCWPLCEITWNLSNLIISISTAWTLPTWAKTRWRNVSFNHACILLWSRNVCLFSHSVAVTPLIWHVSHSSAVFRINLLVRIDSFPTVASKSVDICILRLASLILSLIMNSGGQSSFICRARSLPYLVSIVTRLFIAFRWCLICSWRFWRCPVIIALIATTCASIQISVRSRVSWSICSTCSLVRTLTCSRWFSSCAKVWIWTILIETSLKLLQLLTLCFNSTE